MLVAAAMSIPAVFLIGLDGAAGTLGTVLNWASMVVLTGESLLLFWLSPDRLAWLRSHWWMALVAVLTVPAVLFAIGPAQVLRAARVVTAFQVLRVTRLFKVARVLHRRGERLGRFRHLPWIAVVALAVVFAGWVLADPDASSRRALEYVLERCAWILVPVLFVLVAGVVAGMARLWLHRRARSGAPDSERSS